MPTTEPNLGELPYKNENDSKIAHIPERIEFPKTEAQIVSVVKTVYDANPDSTNLLPSEYADFEEFLEEQYQNCYARRVSIDIEPLSMDYVFQQYAIKRDEMLGRNAFNTFGLYALNYMEGLATVRVGFDRYFQAHEDEEFKTQHRALLLGCSSISTAQEFSDFVHALDSKAEALVTDINPLAVRLSAEAFGAKVIQSDAQRIPIESNSVDLIVTNYLVPNLIDQRGSGIDTLREVFKEVKRALADDGRFVMVEHLNRNDLRWLGYYAHQEGLTFSHRSGGFLHSAVVLSKRTDIPHILNGIPEFIKSNQAYGGRTITEDFRRQAHIYDEELPFVNSGSICLIFEKSG